MAENMQFCEEGVVALAGKDNISNKVDFLMILHII